VTTPPLTFLSGHSLVPTTFIEPWVGVIEVLIPQTTGALTVQFTQALAQLTALLAATPPPLLGTNETVIPIKLVDNLQIAFNNFTYANGAPLAWPPYLHTQLAIENVYNQYSINFYNSPPKPYFIFTP